MMNKNHYSTLKTNFGDLYIYEVRNSITEISFKTPDHNKMWADYESPLIRKAKRQLKEYFEGKRQTFSFSISPLGTAFQLQVWRELSRIPYGETRSYGEIANEINCPGGGRAVGNACGRNPLLIVIPCHRAVGAKSPGGYSGGADMKKALIMFEQSLRNS